MGAPSSYTQSWGTEIENKISALNGQLTDIANDFANNKTETAEYISALQTALGNLQTEMGILQDRISVSVEYTDGTLNITKGATQ